MKESIKNSRYFGAVLIAPLLIFLFIGGNYLKALTFLLGLMAMYEAYKVIKSTNSFKPIPILGYLLLILYYVLGMSIDNLGYIIIFFTLILLCIPVINIQYSFIDSFITMGVFVYAGVFFSLISNIYMKPSGNLLVWLIFISSWVGDTAAYYSGRYLGKRKLCPKVSPKKTIEGSIGGWLGSILGCGIFGILITPYLSINIGIINFFLIGAAAGIMGQFGDLVASSIKRYFKVKDYSNLIPGHGGILDRFDSIIYSSVIIFFYLTFIVGI